MAGRAVEKSHTGFHSTGLGVTRREIKPPDACMGNGTGTHGAGFKRNPQVTFLKPFISPHRKCRLQRKQLCMVKRVAITPHPVLGHGNDGAIRVRDGGGHRHLACLGSSSGFFQQKSHDIWAWIAHIHACLVP